LNILVTGGAGYVGSVLITELIDKGYHVTCLDRFFFGEDYFLQEKFQKNVQLIKDDIRWFDPKILDGIDVVMDLAALSNDPVGELDPQKTLEINHLGRVRVAELSKKNGVRQYILASSASIYGQQEGLVNEESPINPLTTYSKANRKAEEGILSLNDSTFTTTALRFASVYGVSPRMRFDTAVNCMTLDLFKKKKILVGGPDNKRPFIHILDAVESYLSVIDADKKQVGGEIFNVGSDEQNFSMLDLGKKIGDSINRDYDLIIEESPDNRSYFASYEKIRKVLNFRTKYTIEKGVLDIYKKLEDGTLKDDIKTRTVEWYKNLISDSNLAEKILLNDKIL